MEENVLKRILPHSLEAEQSVIGSMLMDRDAIAAASEALAGEDFYNKQYGILFDTICELNDSGSAVDLVTLQERLRMKEVPPEVSGLEFIREILTAPITSANIKQYVKIVSEKSILRKLIRQCCVVSSGLMKRLPIPATAARKRWNTYWRIRKSVFSSWYRGAARMLMSPFARSS